MKNTKLSIKHGCRNVFVWKCISTFGVNELVVVDNITNKNLYFNNVKDNLLKSAT